MYPEGRGAGRGIDVIITLVDLYFLLFVAKDLLQVLFVRWRELGRVDLDLLLHVFRVLGCDCFLGMVC